MNNSTKSDGLPADPNDPKRRELAEKTRYLDALEEGFALDMGEDAKEILAAEIRKTRLEIDELLHFLALGESNIPYRAAGPTVALSDEALPPPPEMMDLDLGSEVTIYESEGKPRVYKITSLGPPVHVEAMKSSFGFGRFHGDYLDIPSLVLHIHESYLFFNPSPELREGKEVALFDDKGHLLPDCKIIKRSFDNDKKIFQVEVKVGGKSEVWSVLEFDQLLRLAHEARFEGKKLQPGDTVQFHGETRSVFDCWHILKRDRKTGEVLLVKNDARDFVRYVNPTDEQLQEINTRLDESKKMVFPNMAEIEHRVKYVHPRAGDRFQIFAPDNVHITEVHVLEVMNDRGIARVTLDGKDSHYHLISLQDGKQFYEYVRTLDPEFYLEVDGNMHLWRFHGVDADKPRIILRNELGEEKPFKIVDLARMLPEAKAIIDKNEREMKELFMMLPVGFTLMDADFHTREITVKSPDGQEFRIKDPDDFVWISRLLKKLPLGFTVQSVDYLTRGVVLKNPDGENLFLPGRNGLEAFLKLMHVLDQLPEEIPFEGHMYRVERDILMKGTTFAIYQQLYAYRLYLPLLDVDGTRVIMVSADHLMAALHIHAERIGKSKLVDYLAGLASSSPEEIDEKLSSVAKNHFFNTMGPAASQYGYPSLGQFPEFQCRMWDRASVSSPENFIRPDPIEGDFYERFPDVATLEKFFKGYPDDRKLVAIIRLPDNNFICIYKTPTGEMDLFNFFLDNSLEKRTRVAAKSSPAQDRTRLEAIAARLIQLKLKCDRLEKSSARTSYICVYRAESASSERVGTGYIESWSQALSNKEDIVRKTGRSAKIDALFVPWEWVARLASPHHVQREVNISDLDLLEGRREVKEPQTYAIFKREDYLYQFAYVREYQQLLKEKERLEVFMKK